MNKSIKRSGCSNLVIGAVLKRYRIQQGYTQNEVADLIHVSRPCYSSWENDYHEIPLSKLVQLADCFELDIMAFICEIIPEEAKNYKIKENHFSKQLTTLNSDINQMKELLGEILVKQNDGYII